MPPATMAAAAVTQTATGGSVAARYSSASTSNEHAASGHTHARKRKRLNVRHQQPSHAVSSSDDDESDEPPFFFPLSPDAADNIYNVQPLGNRLMRQSDEDSSNSHLPGNTRDASFVNSPFRHCNESLLIDILSYCDTPTLAILTSVSYAMYGIIHSHGNGELWRTLLLDDEKLTNSWQYHDGWYNTCVKAYLQHYAPGRLHLYTPHQPLLLNHFYSDYLFHQYYCTSIDTSILSTTASSDTADIAVTSNTSNCNVEDSRHMTYDRFVQQYEQPNIPVVVTYIMSQWKAWKDADEPQNVWTIDNWVLRYGDIVVKCGRTTMKLKDYIHYAKTQVDEAPIYLFDSQFGEKIPALVEQYTVPQYFSSDLFQYFSAATRPRYRWILLGPRLSGSTFHKDPNATSAWNSLLHGGRKHWILYPQHLIPPGCYPSADNSEIVTPMTVAEWLVNHYSEHRQLRRKYDLRRQRAGYKSLRDVYVALNKGQLTAQRAERYIGPVEHTCCSGETIYIPHQWYHLAVNIDTELSLAVTQNYASWNNITDIFEFWAHDPHPSNKPLASELRGRLDVLFPRKLDEVGNAKKKHNDAKQQATVDSEVPKKPKVKQTISLWDSMK